MGSKAAPTFDPKGAADVVSAEFEAHVRAAHASERWHPISEPPTAEDFEPTGQVLCVTIFESGKIHPWFGTQRNQLADADYWMKIQPPAHASEVLPEGVVRDKATGTVNIPSGAAHANEMRGVNKRRRHLD